MPQLARTMGVREVLLDETQDTSPVQLELLVALVQASQRQLRLEPTLMAVGDEKQQIYSFLHPSPYPRLEQVFAGARRLSLGIQYRYGPTLNHAANRLAWALGFDQPTTPARKQDDPQEQFAGLLPGMPSRHLPLLCYAAGTEEEEAAFIAEEIGRVQTCVPEAEIAVLARTRRQARFLSQLLHGFRVTHRFKTSQGESGEEEDGADSTEKVQVSTIHATKGAEFQVVFVTGLAQGVFPSHREGEHLEELKLFFVALTRARYLAYLTYPERVNRKGMERRTGPSWFLGLLG
jgi:superfamily I DNA/RNA helicase